MFEVNVKVTIGTTPELGATLNHLADMILGKATITATQARDAAPAPVVTIDGKSIGQAESIAQAPAAQPAPAPVAQAPVAQPAPVPAVPAAQTPAPVPAVPVAQPAPVPAAPVAQMPAPTYTKEQIASAGAMFMQQAPTNRDKLQTLLAQFGAPYINALPDEQLGAFATALRGMGANI